MYSKHKSVLLDECIEGLNINPDGIYVDGTLGGAGHSKVIASHLSEKGLIFSPSIHSLSKTGLCLNSNISTFLHFL